MKNATARQPLSKGCHKGGGPTSYGIQDAEKVFAVLNLKKDDVMVDIGCGRGEYSLHAARIVGDDGIVYALDRWSPYTENLRERAIEQGLANLIPFTADINKGLPLLNASASLCLLATILHATGLDILKAGLGDELHRVLCTGGRVAILELKKEEQPFGPPLEQRLAPETVEKAFSSCGFTRLSLTDLGFTYLMLFQR